MRAVAWAPRGFAPLLIWNWSGPLEESALRQGIDEANAAGFGGLITRVGYHATPTYLGDQWLQLLRVCARECHARELQFWIGDEGPGRDGTLTGDGSGSGRSGSDGGRIGRQSPQLRSHYLRFQIDDIAREQAANYHLLLTNEAPLYAIAVPLFEETRKLDFSRSISLLEHAPERIPILLARLGADVRVMIFSPARGDYVDLLNSQVSFEFLQNTHERIRNFLGDDWAAVNGFWIQSPSLRDGNSADASQRLPWSPDLLESFAQQPGYELLEWLPALVTELGDDAARLRQDFWGAVSRMAEEGFWQPLTSWAHANGVEYAGSPAATSPLNGLVSLQADVAPIYRALSRPTVDAPALSSESGLDLNRHLGARLCASAAALKTPSGQITRVMAEAWRGAGWQATPSDRLPSLHHLLRQGINGFAVNGAQLNGRDDAILAPSPSELHQPYAARWPVFSTYIARHSFLNSRGRSGARVGMLWPIRSAHAHHHPKGHRLTRWVEEDLYATALMLDDLHFGFLFVEENDLLDAQFEDGKIICGAARHPFELIVLPSVTTLHRSLWDKLASFVENGGKVACLGLLPRYSERGRDHEFEERIGKETLVTVGDLYEAYAEMENSGGASVPTMGFPLTKESESGGRFSCYQPRLNSDVGDALLRVRKILKESLTAEFETQATDILYASRVLSDDESPLDWGEIVAPEIQQETEEASDAALEPIAESEDGFEWDRPFDWNDGDADSAAQSTVDASQSTAESSQSTADALQSTAEGEDQWPRLNLLENLPETASSGGDLFFVFNAGDDMQRINVRLRPTQDGVPHLLDAWSGELRRMAIWTQFPEMEGGGLSLGLDLAPHEAKWLWIAPPTREQSADLPHVEAATWTVEDFSGGVARGYATENGAPRLAIRHGERLSRGVGEEVVVPPPLTLPDSWQSARVGANVASSEDWQWQRGRHLPGDGRRLFGREVWQGVTRSDEANRRAEEQARLELSGIITFRTSFEIAHPPSDLWLPLPPLDVPHDVYLNGELLESGVPAWRESPPWNEASWQWFDLAEFALCGENVLSIVADCREKSPSEGGFAGGNGPIIARVPNRPRIVGDFSLTPDGALTPPESLLLEAGSWHEQGLPFYSGAVDYRQWVKVPRDWDRCRVFLEVSRTRDACGLWLNGRFVGESFTSRPRFDVSKLLLKGASNEVRLRFWNTAQAARDLPAQPSPSGLLGPVRLVAYPLVYQTL